MPDHREQGREQGQSRDHREEDRDRGGERDAVEETEPEQQHPHQRDDHGDPGEQHGAAGGVDRGDRRRPLLEALVEAVAEAGDDEERVVDPDAEADHRRQDRGEVRGVEDVGAEGDEAEPDAEREQRGEDRQAHRDHRAEGDQQHYDRGEQADHEGAVSFFLAFRFLDRAAAELDLEAAARCCLPRLDQPFRFVVFEFVREDVELDGRVRDLAVGADRRRAPADVGVATSLTWGSRSISAKARSIFDFTAADSTPVPLSKTICTVSPDCAGKRFSSRSNASCESEEGSLKSSL